MSAIGIKAFLPLVVRIRAGRRVGKRHDLLGLEQICLQDGGVVETFSDIFDPTPHFRCGFLMDTYLFSRGDAFISCVFTR
jgi:hypothetical protein